MMASTTLPFAAARQFMVDSQLRPNKVTNPILLDAMRQVPRETFLPPPLWSVAYADQDVRLGGGRVLIAPLACWWWAPAPVMAPRCSPPVAPA
jgi:protein-L-isoaspartate O-methyltransferase